MDALIIIGILILFFVGTVISDYRARKSNQEWLRLKALTLQTLNRYEGENREFVEKQAFRFCEICDVIARSGLFESKRNQLLAMESTFILNTLKPLGFFKKLEDENTSNAC